MSFGAGSGAKGWVIRCDVRGRVQEVAADCVGTFAGWEPGQLLTRFVDPGSIPKVLSLLELLQADEPVFEWELNVWQGDHEAGVVTLQVGAARVGPDAWLFAAETSQQLEVLYQQMMQINNEQANALRTATKELANRRGPEARDLSIFDEISQLNNDLMNAQRELARKNAELARLNDLKNQFLGMAAHDLRKPIGVITMCSEFLQMEVGDQLNEEQQRFLTFIQEHADGMVRLIDGFLNISMIESGQLVLERSPTDLAAVVEHAIQLVDPHARKQSITIARELPGELPLLDVDQSKIEQALTNILANGVEHSPPGGTVEIAAAIRGEALHLSVRDCGEGLESEQLEKLLRPFEKGTSRKSTGDPSIGLGLAITSKVAQAHGGKLQVESSPGEGSTFTIVLPLSTSA